MKYTSSIPKGRRLLANLVASSGDVIVVADAVRILGSTRADAAKALARWTKQGWLRRIRRGIYVPATLNSINSHHVVDDPWILIPGLFSPAYVGGRTAAEYWELTEQIFNDIVVMTTHPIREKAQRWHGADFMLKHIQERKVFGVKTVWRGSTKVMVSDLPRTVIDLLDDPAIGGGIRHVADCFDEYLKRDDRNDCVLLEHGDRLGNGAVFKRLGYLAERRGDKKLAHACLDRLTKGISRLDPRMECSKILTRWRLCIPSCWSGVVK